LQRVLAARGVASRRRAEELIRAGRVNVDGEVVTELGTKVDPRAAQIRVDGHLLRAQAPRYLLLNKPRGYITTTSDERERRTVMDLIDVRERVYPVGRLDRDTEGLLLLTNDGDVANRVMHPRYGLTKEYHVLTLSRPTEATLQKVRSGVVVDGHRVVPDEFRILRESREGLLLTITLHEGINRVVRRLMEAVGIPVTRLRRVRVGPLAIAGIPLGAWRDLTDGELRTLLESLRLDREAEPAPPRPSRRGPTRSRRPGGAEPAADHRPHPSGRSGPRSTDRAAARADRDRRPGGDRDKPDTGDVRRGGRSSQDEQSGQPRGVGRGRREPPAPADRDRAPSRQGGARRKGEPPAPTPRRRPPADEPRTTDGRRGRRPDQDRTEQERRQDGHGRGRPANRDERENGRPGDGDGDDERGRDRRPARGGGAPGAPPRGGRPDRRAKRRPPPAGG